jgi:hypothetical protein
VDERGYEVVRDVVPADAVDGALRHIHLDAIRNGMPVDAISSWIWSAHWFPHLKWDEPIASLVQHLPPELRDGELCDPQIVLHPPDDGSEQPLTPHVDREPSWANGRRYLRIVGVPLTRADRDDGALVVWPFGGATAEPVEVDAGDLVVMHPDLPHTSGVNRRGSIRYVVYFRFLAAS